MSTATTECSYWLVAPASRNLSSVHQLALAHAVGAHIWISSFRVWTPPPAPSRFGRDPQTNFLPHAVEPVLGARVPAASAPGAGLRALQLSGSRAVVMKSVPPRKAASPELNLPMPSLRVSFLVGRGQSYVAYLLLQEMSAFTCICMQRSVHRQFILICTI